MIIETNTRRVTISLRQWIEKIGDYATDIFDDLEIGFPMTHDRIPGDEAFQATDAELNELIVWWEDNVAIANKGYDHSRYDDYDHYLLCAHVQGLVAIDDEELQAGNIWYLDVVTENKF